MKLDTTHKTMVAAVAVLAALALPMVAGAENKLVVRNAGDTADAMVVTDTGYIGLGTNSPTAVIHTKTLGKTQVSAGFRMDHITETDAGAAVSATNPSPYVAPNFTFFRNNQADAGNGVLPRSGDLLGALSFGSLGSIIGSSINVSASGTWTSTSAPTSVAIKTTPGGANVVARTALTVANTGTTTIYGGLRINPLPYTSPTVTTPNPVKPACASTVAGTLWFTKSTGAGVADKLEVCVTIDGSAYSWKAIAFQ